MVAPGLVIVVTGRRDVHTRNSPLPYRCFESWYSIFGESRRNHPTNQYNCVSDLLAVGRRARDREKPLSLIGTKAECPSGHPSMLSWDIQALSLPPVHTPCAQTKARMSLSPALETSTPVGRQKTMEAQKEASYYTTQQCDAIAAPLQ